MCYDDTAWSTDQYIHNLCSSYTGKSTFYNAVTRAVLARNGRLMAEVAPHPFTTIEPNIGKSLVVTAVMYLAEEE